MLSFSTVHQKKIVSTLSGHTKLITDVLFHPTQNICFSTSADKTARIWQSSRSGYDCAHVVKSHSSDVTGCSIHPTGDYLATSSLDSTWALHDIATATCISQHNTQSGLHCVQIHPDGLILGGGTKDILQIWDLKVGKLVAKFEEHKGTILDLSFSENGYYLATAADDNVVKLWDLRKVKCFHSLELPDTFQLSSVEWDNSGSYIAATGADIRIYVGKTLNHAATLPGQATAAKWGKDAQFLASTSMDRSLKFWGKA